jgi:prevent-host-death family protein
MLKVTSGQFQKEFGRYRCEAHREAVIITNHGRDDLALISAQEYARLVKFDQVARYAWELPDEVIEAFGSEPVPQHTRAFDHEFKG